MRSIRNLVSFSSRTNEEPLSRVSSQGYDAEQSIKQYIRVDNLKMEIRSINLSFYLYFLSIASCSNFAVA